MKIICIYCHYTEFSYKRFTNFSIEELLIGISEQWKEGEDLI